MGSAIWSIFTARRYVKRGICRRRVSIGFVLTIASRGPSAIAELFVAFFVAFDIFVVSKDRDFIFGVQVDGSKSQQTDNKPSLKGAWLRHVTRFYRATPCYARYMPSSCVCPSVCVCVCHSPVLYQNG